MQRNKKNIEIQKNLTWSVTNRRTDRRTDRKTICPILCRRGI